jgi:hypothetical protein
MALKRRIMSQIFLETHIHGVCDVQRHDACNSEPTNIIEMLRCKNANYLLRPERLTALRSLLYLSYPL